MSLAPPGAEGSGLPAGREPLDAGSPSPGRRRSAPSTRIRVRPGPVRSDRRASQADDLFDAMFLTGGMRPPVFAAVDHDLGFPPPQAPDLASAFLAALDAIDDRRFVTPVPEEPPAAHVAPAAPRPWRRRRLGTGLRAASAVAARTGIGGNARACRRNARGACPSASKARSGCRGTPDACRSRVSSPRVSSWRARGRSERDRHRWPARGRIRGAASASTNSADDTGRRRHSSNRIRCRSFAAARRSTEPIEEPSSDRAAETLKNRIRRGRRSRSKKLRTRRRSSMRCRRCDEAEAAADRG